MRIECIQSASAAMGRALTKAESDELEKLVMNSMRSISRRDPQAWASMTAVQRLQAAGAAAAQGIVADAQLKQQRDGLKILAQARIEQHMRDSAMRGIDGLSALDRVIAFHADAKSNFLSIESQAKAISRDSIRQILVALEASNPKWFGLFENQEGIRSIMQELFGEPSGNADARAGAQQYHAVAEQLRQRFNRAGGDVGELDDWGLPHHHSQLKVAKAGRDQWVSDVLPLLDRDHYHDADTGARMSDTQLRDFLGNAWLTIATGGANKVDPGQFHGSGARANRGNAARQIHFKDSQGYFDYQGTYGDRSLYEVLVGHIEGVSKDIAHVETFGPNPDATYRLVRDVSVKALKLADPVQSGKIDERAVKSDTLYNIVSGKTQPVASEMLAKSFDTLRSWLIAARLGSSVITSFSDDATLHLTGKLNNLEPMKLLANELTAFNPANRLEERMAQRAGLGLNTMISSLNRFGQDGLGASFSSKLANSVMRVSGLNAMTDARKRAFGVTMMGSMGNVARSHADLASIDPVDHRILLSKGITEADFSVWKKAQLEDWGGGNDSMLTPESIYRIPDAALSHMGNPQALKEQAATRLLGVVLEETDVAVIEPGAKERSITGATLQRGTWKGELTRSFFLFKSFPLAMIERHWARGMSQPNAGGRAAYLATLLASTTLLGMASLQVNELLTGRDPRNMNPLGKGGTKNWLAAMLKGGSLGIYGDFLFSDSTQYGNSPLATVTGPVLGLAEDAFNLTQGNIMQAAMGAKTHAGAELVKFVRGNTPGASLWYAKAVLDHMIFHQLEEYFSPGYLAKMKSRAQKQFGQKYWWQPGQVAPDRAPDLSAVNQ